MNCVFCKIIAGQVPAYMVHQDQWTMSFLDINPVSRGHCLVVPRDHVETFRELPPIMFSPLMTSVSFVSSALMTALSATGFNLFLNNGSIAGQIIPHLHFHILPRGPGDGTSFKAVHRKMPAEELKDIQKSIVDHILSLPR